MPVSAVNIRFQFPLTRVDTVKKKNTIRSYREAGVDIAKGDAFASFIGGIDSPAVSKGIGGFAGALELDLQAYNRPVLMSSTDGVGTKLLVAKELGDYRTIGIDLVAMCVNDLIVCGARPLQFLDYIACGRIDEALLGDVIAGIVRGCELAECSLGGGETAEMPDMYGPHDIDLAGFCTGVADQAKMLPKPEEMRAGDLIFGIPSAGIHSNGLSLARKVIPPDSPFFPELLVPTLIYVSALIPLLKTNSLTGAAHITGGGLYNNIRRILPARLVPELSYDWPVPKIFGALQELGDIPEDEMYKVFNMGIGIALITGTADESKLKAAAEADGTDLYLIGRLADG